ncbi:MAG: Zinc-dependent sulfurtransferase SufU [Candidatus Anoxychlamydiales bacterium]|nr:Zinc-dependent sulfurtransferase SufU [Candidatus Anoxychlamydiales bacterium]NGX35279.1 Zinc-dependent sulfurtransferase SufU [Candidatus Anoxychlamydiales bacterium]
MKEDIKELYQEIILEHSRCPRNFKEMERPTTCAKGHNAMCGDKLIVYLKLNKAQIIKDISFKGTGCAICIASASLMTEAVLGKTLAEAKKMFEYFHSMVTDDCNFECLNLTEQKLAALSGVKNYPTRVKCATLAWHAMMLAFQNKPKNSLDDDQKNCSCKR